MQIKVGTFSYEIVARPDLIPHPSGGTCHGLAWPDQQRIEFSTAAPLLKRMAVVWHQLSHLLKADFDIHGAELLDEETCCNLVGLAMAMISPMDLMRLHVFVCQGIDAPSAMMCPGMRSPIPMMHFTRPR